MCFAESASLCTTITVLHNKILRNCNIFTSSGLFDFRSLLPRYNFKADWRMSRQNFGMEHSDTKKFQKSKIVTRSSCQFCPKWKMSEKILSVAYYLLITFAATVHYCIFYITHYTCTTYIFKCGIPMGTNEHFSHITVSYIGTFFDDFFGNMIIVFAENYEREKIEDI